MAIVNRIFTVLGKPADAKDEQVNKKTLQGGTCFGSVLTVYLRQVAFLDGIN